MAYTVLRQTHDISHEFIISALALYFRLTLVLSLQFKGNNKTDNNKYKFNSYTDELLKNLHTSLQTGHGFCLFTIFLLVSVNLMSEACLPF